MTRPPGAAIGRYQILRFLARGETSIVYEALEPELDRKVALKILLPSAARDPDQRDYFLRLARKLARLNHANLLPIVDYGLAGDVPFMASTIAGGGVLAGDMPAFSQAGEALSLVAAMAQAAGALHRDDIVHGRIGPGHVLFDALGKPLLAGYGRPYTAGQRIAAPAYVAPEQSQGQEPDPRTDIYQLGALLYQLLLGVPPEPGAAALADSRPEELNPEVAAVLDRAMATEPDQRFQSAGELADQLTVAAQQLPPAETAAAEAAKTPPPETVASEVADSKEAVVEQAGPETSPMPGRLSILDQKPTLLTVIIVGFALSVTICFLVAIFGISGIGGRLRQPLATAQVDTNVRAGPSIDYELVGILRQGQQAAIHGISPDGRWWQIDFAGAPGDKGWVSAAFVTVDQTGSVQVIEPPPLVPAAALPSPSTRPETTPWGPLARPNV